MTKESIAVSKLLAAFICGALLLSLNLLVAVGQEPEGSRGATSDAYKKVEAGRVIQNRRVGKGLQKRVYRTNSSFPDGSPPRGQIFVTVGVTISRGRLATDAEKTDSRLAKVMGCVQWNSEKCVARKEMVLVRTVDDEGVSDKDQIQMSIEYLAYVGSDGSTQSGRIGYLYVINREEFSDRSFGFPKLIFPTLNTYDGDNRVLPGKTVAMPAPDRPWTISKSTAAKVQSFETYTIIASAEPLVDLKGFEIKPESKSIILEEALFDTWMKDYGGNESRADLEDSKGQLVTQREAKSSKATTIGRRGTDDDVDDLLQDDPPPQVIFRKVVKPRGTLLFTVRIPFKDQTATSVPRP